MRQQSFCQRFIFLMVNWLSGVWHQEGNVSSRALQSFGTLGALVDGLCVIFHGLQQHTLFNHLPTELGRNCSASELVNLRKQSRS